MKNAIEEAVYRAGSQKKLALVCHTTQQSISAWLKQGYIPYYRHAALINRKFDISVEQLCEPDDTDLFV